MLFNDIIVYSLNKHRTAIKVMLNISIITLIMYYSWICFENKCNMCVNLIDLLSITTYIFKENKIEFWMNWGYVRNNRILSEDYDLDVIISESDYTRILNLKNIFKSYGYTLYGKDDEVPHNILGKLYSKKLSRVSLRLYNDKSKYYIEFFENYVIEGEKINEIINKYPNVKLPSPILSNISYVCIGRQTNNPTATEMCLKYDDIYPLQRVIAFPEEYKLLAPNRIENVLKFEYGDNYMVRELKGYKAFVCYTNPIYMSLLLSFFYLLFILYNINCRFRSRFRKLKE